MRARAVLLAAVLVLGCLPAARAVYAQAVPGRPGREVSLPPSEVKDTFFAYFLGIIVRGFPVDIDNEHMREILVEFESTMDVPFDLVSRVTQQGTPGAAEGAEDGQAVTVQFSRDVAIPVPFALLFYHPGSIFASRYVSFAVRRLEWTDPAAGGPPEQAFDLVMDRGYVLVDIDDWLEALFSAHLEDTWIRHVAFFRWDRDWIGMLEGSGRVTGRTRRAYFDFTRNRILFPASDELVRASRAIVP